MRQLKTQQDEQREHKLFCYQWTTMLRRSCFFECAIALLVCVSDTQVLCSVSEIPDAFDVLEEQARLDPVRAFICLSVNRFEYS
jgi:hypothetical protein